MQLEVPLLVKTASLHSQEQRKWGRFLSLAADHLLTKMEEKLEASLSRVQTFTKIAFCSKSLSLPSTVLRTVYFLTLEVKVYFSNILVFRGHGGEGENHMTAQNQGQNLGISVLLNKIFQLVLLFSSPSEGPGTQKAGFFQDPLGETVFFWPSLLQVYVSALPGLLNQLQSTFWLSIFVDISCVLSSPLSGLFGHVACSHFLFLACILVKFRQREKNGCVSASQPAA